MERFKCLLCIEIHEARRLLDKKIDRILPEEREYFSAYELSLERGVEETRRCEAMNGNSVCLEVPEIKVMLKFLDVDTVYSKFIAELDWRELKEWPC